MKITLFGGTGFVGRALCGLLAAQGHALRVPSRDGRCAGLPAGVECVRADPHDALTLGGLIRGQDAVINLIGILHGDEAAFRRTHVELGEHIARACLAEGVPVLLHMSALNADPHGPSLYLRSKGEAEERVHALAGYRLRVTSFRPSVIFGPEDSFLNRFATLLRLAPGVMLLPGARARFAPVYVGDVAAAFARALTDAAQAGQRIDLCGPRDYSLLELVRLTARWSGHSRLILPMPDAMARAMARLMERLPNPPLTRDNLDSMRIDSVCATDTPRQPTAMESIAPSYLGQ
ncbi:MAG TPA: complex I NDUFA9 subunit family protein [Chromatiales bacterium]|nr:complex I NDUFA9 subunit family protein [Chromatiales bacterium]